MKNMTKNILHTVRSEGSVKKKKHAVTHRAQEFRAPMPAMSEDGYECPIDIVAVSKKE